MISAVTFVVIAALVLTGLGLNRCARRLIGPKYARRAAARRFAREFAELAAGTDVDLTSLRGPAHGSSAMAAYSERASDAAVLEAKTLSIADQDYYAASWRNVRGEFTVSPPSALVLATHLTANLLLNRGLLPVDTARPTLLPETWTFASAQGYRNALSVCARTDDEVVPKDELTKALTQFEDFYFEMLTLST